MSHKIYAPQVQLFAFHLQASTFFSSNLFGNQPKSSDWLWKTCDDIVSKTLQHEFKLKPLIDLNKQEYNPRVPLSRKAPVTAPDSEDSNVKNPQYIQISNEVFLVNQEPLLIKGFIYPIRIYNSYGLWLRLGCSKLENNQEKAMDIQVLRHLNPENCFLSLEKQGYLGQTIIITAWLTPEDARKEPQELKNIADECVQHFFFKEKGIHQPQFNLVEELSSSVVFQYGVRSHLPTSGSILIRLFRDKPNNNQPLISNEDLFDLLFYRARIIKAFQQITRTNRILIYYTRSFLKEIKKLQLDNNTKLDKEKLNRLNNKLIQLPLMAQEYEKSLAMLNNFKTEIEVSIDKYSEIVECVYQKNIHEDLRILKIFVDGNWPFYDEQIKEYFRFFKYGSSLIDKAISSIRGQVEIAQAELESHGQKTEKERDFKQQITILAIGSGIGVSGILSSSIATIYSAPNQNANSNNQGLVLAGAISFGLLGGFLATITIWLLPRRFPWIKWLFLK
jgi:hypothetical protein